MCTEFAVIESYQQYDTSAVMLMIIADEALYIP